MFVVLTYLHPYFFKGFPFFHRARFLAITVPSMLGQAYSVTFSDLEPQFRGTTSRPFSWAFLSSVVVVLDLKQSESKQTWNNFGLKVSFSLYLLLLFTTLHVVPNEHFLIIYKTLWGIRFRISRKCWKNVSYLQVANSESVINKWLYGRGCDNYS